VSNDVFKAEKPSDLHRSLPFKRRLGRAHAAYLVATALATLGWFGLSPGAPYNWSKSRSSGARHRK
jgi:hypothetical protein